jgi:ribokinase
MTSASLSRVAVVGSINLDITANVERLPTPGETVAGGTIRRDIGGKGANQAVAAAKLGAEVRMIGAIGEDDDGVWMRERIATAGVDVSRIQTASVPSGTALIVVDKEAENQIAVCPGANEYVNIDGVTFNEDEVILTQLEISLGLVEQIAASTDNYLAVNAAPAQQLNSALLNRVDLFIVNETEYQLMPELNSAPLVAVTYGARGAALIKYGTEMARVDGVKTVAVNTVGAGDSFCAALVLALRSGADDVAALNTACRVGAAAVAHPSSQPPFDHLSHYANN